jgi:hypothetical protein
MNLGVQQVKEKVVYSNSEGALDLFRNNSSNLFSPDCIEHRNEIMNFCENIKNFTGIQITCQSHARESTPIHAAAPDDPLIPQEQPCMTLWFSGFRDDRNARCDGKGNGYRVDYARALMSYRKHAFGVLQPVLMLGQDGLDSTERNKSAAFSKWAKEQGAIVLLVEELSFQNFTHQWCCPNHRTQDGVNGPFLRLDIPKFVWEWKLFDIPGVCPRSVLYTDADVIFMNDITIEDMIGLKSFLNEDVMLLYGREAGKLDERPANSGVMLMDVIAFGDEWPQILNWATDKEGFIAYDQGLLNDYFSQNKETDKKRAMLPIHWNWKSYWRLEPSVWSDIKILHFHGPKFGRGLQRIASCNFHLDDFPIAAYKTHIYWGICCDGGKTAHRAFELDREFRPPATDIC